MHSPRWLPHRRGAGQIVHMKPHNVLPLGASDSIRYETFDWRRKSVLSNDSQSSRFCRCLPVDGRQRAARLLAAKDFISVTRCVLGVTSAGPCHCVAGSGTRRLEGARIGDVLGIMIFICRPGSHRGRFVAPITD